jgi:hypothetical protein
MRRRGHGAGCHIQNDGEVDRLVVRAAVRDVPRQGDAIATQRECTGTASKSDAAEAGVGGDVVVWSQACQADEDQIVAGHRSGPAPIGTYGPVVGRAASCPSAISPREMLAKIRRQQCSQREEWAIDAIRQAEDNNW